MKKILVIALFISIALCGAGVIEAAYYDEGNDGDSWETAYIIDSLEDFILFRDRINEASDDAGKYYKLDTYLNLTSTSWGSGIGGYDNPFMGHFDGQNNIINVSLSGLNSSLFYKVSSDVDTIAIRNLKLTGTFTGSLDTAGLIMTLYSGIVENCSLDCSVQSRIGLAGGFAVGMRGGTIRNCEFLGDVTTNSTSDVGGFISVLSNGSIENCSVDVSRNAIISGDRAGGFVGRLEGGRIEGSYVRGYDNNIHSYRLIIKGIEAAGGIAGYMSGGIITNCDVVAKEISAQHRGAIVGVLTNKFITKQLNTYSWLVNYSWA